MMLLILHIIIALETLVGAAFGKARLTIVSLLLTLLSGLGLAIMTPASLGRFCISGLVLSILSLGILHLRRVHPVSVGSE